MSVRAAGGGRTGETTGRPTLGALLRRDLHGRVRFTRYQGFRALPLTRTRPAGADASRAAFLDAGAVPGYEGMVRVAAVQIEVQVGRLADNLAHVEQLAEGAFAAGARLVALPEFFPGPVIPAPTAWDCVLPPENAALAMLRQLAARYRGWIGGSMLVARGDDVYNAYHLVEPDGTVHVHDKDLPTMWENAFYRGGGDPGLFATGLGTLGAAVCWELIRAQTLRRLAGRVELAVTGTHWWSLPENWPGLGPLAALAQYNRYLAEQAPVEFARHLGVPVLQASHAGTLRGDFLVLPGVDWSLPYVTRFVGTTQIVDATGHVLASRQTSEGAGFVCAEVTPGAVPVVAATPDRYWLPALPFVHRAYWHHQNAVCRSYYRRHGRRRGLTAAASASRAPGRRAHAPELSAS